MTNRLDDIQPLIQNYRSKINNNEPELLNRILDDFEELLHLFKQKNEIINELWNVHENEKYLLAQNTLDPLEQILYSSLIGIRTLDQEAQSESTKEYLASLRNQIERQLTQLKKASISVYPICMQDLGPYGAIKSLYEQLKVDNNITIDIEFHGTLERQPHKIEIQLYRFFQQMIHILETVQNIKPLIVSIHEKDNQIVLTFESDSLVDQVRHSSLYQLLKGFVDSLEEVEMIEQNECQINVVLQTNN